QVRHHRTLFLALVSQHRAAHAVPDRPDTFDTCAAFLIDLDESALVQLDTRAGGEQILGVGPAPNGDDDLVEVEALRTLGVGVADGDSVSPDLRARDFRAQAYVQAQLLEVPQRLLGELLVRDGEEFRQRLEDDDVAPEPAPDASELQPDDACTDDPEPLRHRIQLEGAPGVDDALAVKGRRTQLDGRGATCEHHVLGGQLAPCAVHSSELDALSG